MSIADQLYLDSLRRSQWLSPQDLVRYQAPLIERLVRHAATQTDFYPERLSPLFHGADPAFARIDLSRWHEVPVITRARAVDHVEQMKARSLPPDTGEVRSGRSSGSTGRPLVHFRSRLADMAADCMLDRVFEIHDVDLFAPLGFITLDSNQDFPYPHGTRRRTWNRTATDPGVFVMDVMAEPAQLLEWLERVRPAHVLTYPVTLREVAKVALTEGSSLRLKTFLSTGEILEPESQAAVTQAFDCRVIDLYGVREIGQVAFQCPSGAGYHVCSEALLMELLGDDDRPVAPGEYGRVVVTVLYNYAMPLIRYDIGDYALAAKAPCSCGRGLMLLEQIAGRGRNMVLLPDGTKKQAPRGWTDLVSHHLKFRRIQAVQTATNVLELRYEPEEGSETPNVVELTVCLRRIFHPEVEIRLTPVERIERGAGMKLEHFVSLVKN